LLLLTALGIAEIVPSWMEALGLPYKVTSEGKKTGCTNGPCCHQILLTLMRRNNVDDEIHAQQLLVEGEGRCRGREHPIARTCARRGHRPRESWNGRARGCQALFALRGLPAGQRRRGGGAAGRAASAELPGRPPCLPGCLCDWATRVPARSRPQGAAALVARAGPAI